MLPLDRNLDRYVRYHASMNSGAYPLKWCQNIESLSQKFYLFWSMVSVWSYLDGIYPWLRICHKTRHHSIESPIWPWWSTFRGICGIVRWFHKHKFVVHWESLLAVILCEVVLKRLTSDDGFCFLSLCLLNNSLLYQCNTMHKIACTSYQPKLLIWMEYMTIININLVHVNLRFSC